MRYFQFSAHRRCMWNTYYDLYIYNAIYQQAARDNLIQPLSQPCTYAGMISLVHGTRFIIIGTCSKNGTYFFLELHSYFMIPWDSPRLNVSIYTPYILIYYHAGIDSGDEVLEKIYTIIHTPEGYLYGRASIFAGSNPSTTKPLHYRRVHLQTTIEKISAKILTQFEKLLTWTWKLF